MKNELRDITFKLSMLTCMHRYYISTAANAMGVYRGQPQIMDYLIENGSSTQKELADFLQVSPASVAVSIKRMTKAGLLQKHSDENDMRANRIAITDKGVEIANACRTEFDKIDRQMFSGFSEEELEQLSDYIGRMNKNLGGDKLRPEEIFDMLSKAKESEKKAASEE